MNPGRDFDIKYIDPEENFNSSNRSMARIKILGAISYLLLLAAVPALLYVWGAQTPSLTKAISSTSTSIFEGKGLAVSTYEIKVLKNDSYWKISKRYCAEGKYYLSIKDINGGKALFEGDTVVIHCSL